MSFADHELNLQVAEHPEFDLHETDPRTLASSHCASRGFCVSI